MRNNRSLRELSKTMRGGQKLASELIQERIEFFTSDEGMFVDSKLFAEKAIEWATALDQCQKEGEYLGRLHGASFVIPTTLTSLSPEEVEMNGSSEQPAIIQALLQEGAFCLAQVADHISVVNAIQTGFSDFGVLSDPWGLALLLASAKGLYAFTPTAGLISELGLDTTPALFSQVDSGITLIAPSIDDLAILFDVLAKVSRADSTSVPRLTSSLWESRKTSRVGMIQGTEAKQSGALDRAMSVLKDNGFALEQTSSSALEECTREFADLCVMHDSGEISLDQLRKHSELRNQSLMQMQSFDFLMASQPLDEMPSDLPDKGSQLSGGLPVWLLSSAIAAPCVALPASGKSPTETVYCIGNRFEDLICLDGVRALLNGSALE